MRRIEMITNEMIAKQLQSHARELTKGKSNLYRVRAYRRAAEWVLSLDREVEDLLSEEGKDFLKQFPGIGSHLSESITHFAKTGDWKTFDEIRNSQRGKR
jgi:DNA polymerase/3'-5' exonuclease PolX